MDMNKTPDLIKLYIKSCAIGFALSVVFVALLIGFDVMGLRHLVLHSNMGILPLVMIWFFNGIVFAGVQFAYAIMSMADDDDDDFGGGHMAPVYLAEPVPVRVDRKPRR
ncbi:hypothetical protein [Thalassorhabdomicrobium marinisediminis]|uniref:hypothetical protein n=1 Tax=Thalassorhabdomicrobium marinisediminis TaxID=2170577 RepID=UPI00249228B7|nr:hypothetical protein [Thalassorhabdomicrobium marinisediminis]